MNVVEGETRGLSAANANVHLINIIYVPKKEHGATMKWENLHERSVIDLVSLNVFLWNNKIGDIACFPYLVCYV